MAATVRISYASGAGPSLATAESGIVFSRSEAQAPAAGVAPIPIPNSPGTNYSWPMVLVLEVTATDTTTISNRRIYHNASGAANLALWFAALAAYRQSAVGLKPPDVGTQPLTTPTPTGGGAPGSYTLMSSTPQLYDNTGVSAGSTGANGAFVELVGGVDSNYTGGSGRPTIGGAITVSYDEV